MEPQRTDPADAGPLSEADRAARIEQLLLSGLDHYFGGNYEQAINVWTRVAFLERGHGRARAYIERARSALAERQRESEESLDQGISAYQSGDWQRARDLLTRAVEQGGANELALMFLQRLGHLDSIASPPAPEPTAPGVSTARRVASEGSTRRTHWLATVAASVVITALVLLGTFRTASWLRESPVEVRTGEVGTDDPLPIVRDAERRLDRAQAFREAGRLHEALRELDAIEMGDPLRPQADQLRSDIQRMLLSAVAEDAVAEEQRQ